jgi:hypothetical protein
MAPEVITKQGATASADMWAFGVLLYEALTGANPFDDSVGRSKDPEVLEVQNNIMRVKQQCVPNKNDLDHRFPEARGLIDELLHYDPKKRPTAQAVKQHPFFTGINWSQLRKKSSRPPPTGVASLRTRLLAFTQVRCCRRVRPRAFCAVAPCPNSAAVAARRIVPAARLPCAVCHVPRTACCVPHAACRPQMDAECQRNFREDVEQYTGDASTFANF